MTKRIHIQKDGPYRVEAGVPLRKELSLPDENNNPLTWKAGESYAPRGDYDLCRCGRSGNKPFCDRTHERIDWDGKETASHQPYSLSAGTFTGPGMDLMDARELCSRARFCHRKGGTWILTKGSDREEAKKLAIQQACDCPSGRLTAIDKEREERIEPEFEPSISVTEDLPAGVSGPLWAKGGIEVVGTDGKPYEVRNRQTLCRCGHSENKPFCDGSHLDVRFDDSE